MESSTLLVGGGGGRTLVAAEQRSTASASGEDRRRRVIGRIVRRYWKCVYDYVRRKGYDDERARDLTQGFFLEIVLERDLIAQADPTKGRFRPFLFLALNRYLANVRKRTACHGRIPESRLISLDAIDPWRLPQTPTGSSRLDVYDDAQIPRLIECALEQVEAECREKGRAAHWQVFRERVLRPIVDETDRPRLKDVCGVYGIDEAKASNMIVTVRRRLQHLLKQGLQGLASLEARKAREVGTSR